MNAAGAVEFELRFQVPKAALAGVLRAFAGARTEAVDLHATYFDTADGRLAAAGHVLRLRREGRQWVQALKSRGDGLAARPEHEVARGGGRRMPALDLAAHAATPEGQAVQALLADDAPLVERLRTRIRRLTRVLRHAGARIEVCLDRGRLAGGGATREVCEVGRPAARPAGPGRTLGAAPRAVAGSAHQVRTWRSAGAGPGGGAAAQGRDGRLAR